MVRDAIVSLHLSENVGYSASSPALTRSAVSSVIAMGRKTKNPIVLLALSPAATATALAIRPDEVKEAIDNELLPDRACRQAVPIPPLAALNRRQRFQMRRFMTVL
jgi:hypothetical protein